MSSQEVTSALASTSLADRISEPGPTSNGENGKAPAQINEPASKTPWAEEVASPTMPAPQQNLQGSNEEIPVEPSQTDGAGELLGGSDLREPDYNVEVKLSDIQADPNNPLYSVKSFDELGGLSPEILKGIYALNFKKPSKIQERALPLLLANPPQNMIGQSQSGTGKTAAFVLTMLSRLDRSRPTTPQALCLAPSRELARQIMGVVQVMGSFIDTLTVQFAIPQKLERGQKVEAQVVVGTPGTVLDMIKRRSLDVSQLRVFVLDEADNMLDQQGLGEQCIRVKK